MFTACHPVLSTEARVALTLRLLGGLTTDEIARAFIVPEPTIAQRIVRAKKTLAKAAVPYEVPRGPDRAERLASVLEVLYLIFNEGYSATAGDDWVRPALCEEAMRLGRVLARAGARRARGARPGGVDGTAGLAAARARRPRRRSGAACRSEPRALGSPADRPRPGGAAARRGARRASGAYVLQAAIAACHARAASVETTDWPAIAALYARLVDLTGSPIVRLNHAVAVGMADGPAGRSVAGRCVDRGGRAGVVSLRAERARRSAGEAGAAGRGARRVRSGRGPGDQRARARIASRPRAGGRRLGRRGRPPPGLVVLVTRIGRTGSPGSRDSGSGRARSRARRGCCW